MIILVVVRIKKIRDSIFRHFLEKAITRKALDHLIVPDEILLVSGLLFIFSTAVRVHDDSG